jgi:hypothetical protein
MYALSLPEKSGVSSITMPKIVPKMTQTKAVAHNDAKKQDIQLLGVALP